MMLQSIKRFFDQLAPQKEQTEQEKQHALHLAVSVLLVEMTRMDGQVCEQEREHLNKVLEEQFKLSFEEKQELTDLAKETLDGSTDYYQFTSVINEHFDQPQKIQMIEQLWQVAFSDGKLDAHEEHYLRKIHSLLHVSHSDFMKTKYQAQD
jgi:uncharacterized tellurite resistance protein B-like protein